MADTMKEWALLYADMNLAVFPLKPKDKRPATSNGCKAATLDKNKISDWWDEHPDHNIGIATGKISGGLLVIDLDIDEDKGLDGYEVLKAWQRVHGELPDTSLSITGRGGYHYLYRDAATYGNKVNLYDGVDIRGEGGYIVAPPSVHPNGKLYEWEQDPYVYGIAQANERVIDFVCPTPSKWENKSFHTPETIPEGERNSTLHKLACSMRARGDAEEAIRAAVEATNGSRCVPPLKTGEVEIILKSAMKYESGTAPYKTVVDDGRTRVLKAFKPITAVTAAELDKMDIPPVEWIVEQILPVGLSMIGAPSKYYKSYMALGLCVAICTGGKFLNFDCTNHACLYFDLESTKRRPKSRLDQIVGDFMDKPDNLYIITGTDEPGRIGDGFEAQVEYQIQQHPDIKLVIVDVFQMIRQPAKKNQSGYDRDYEDFRGLKQIADKYGIGLMLIHHTRKMKDPTDVFNELSGSVGVMGALDCAWIITKEDRYAAEGTIHITGRDMETQKLKIRFNKKSFQWEYVGTEDDIEAQRFQSEYEQSPIVETIKKLVKQGDGHWEGSASDIKEASKYLGWEIYDDIRRIGSLINKYEGLLWAVDGINYEIKRRSKERKYIFNVTDATNVTDVSNVTDVTKQINIDDVAT